VLTAQGMSHIVVAVPGCLVTRASYARFTYVVSDPLTDLSRGWILGLQCGGKMRTAKQFSCTTLLPVWTNANHGFLVTEVLVSLSKVVHVPWNVLHILQNDPPSSAKMDGPWVKCVTRTLCSMTVSVRCFLRYPPAGTAVAQWLRSCATNR